MLRLPRNLCIEVLCLPRILHFEVRKVALLPRNLRWGEGSNINFFGVKYHPFCDTL